METMIATVQREHVRLYTCIFEVLIYNDDNNGVVDVGKLELDGRESVPMSL